MWSFLGDRIGGILAEGSRRELGFRNRHVLYVAVNSVDGDVISQLGTPTGLFVNTAISEIRDGVRVVGTVVLYESVIHVWQRTALVFIGAFLFSCAIFLTLRTLPLRALDQSTRERDEALAELIDLT